MSGTRIIGFIIVLFSIFIGYPGLKRDFQIKEKGLVVEMRIVEIPSSCWGTKAKHFMKVKYGTQVFSKQTAAGFCEHYQTGDAIQMRYLPGYDTIQFPEENIIIELISTIILGLTGIGIFFYKEISNLVAKSKQ